MGIEKILSGNEDSEGEEELAPPLIRSRRSRGPTVSVGIEVGEEPTMVGEPIATEELRVMEETERVKIDDPPQLKIASTSLTTSEDEAEMRPGSQGIMMSVLKIHECSPTRLIGSKTPINEALSVQVLFSSSEGNGYDFVHEPAPHGAS